MEMQYLLHLKYFCMINVVLLWRLNLSRWLIMTEEWISLLACLSSVRANLLIHAFTETPCILFLKSKPFTFSANQHHHFTYYMLVLVNLIMTA